MNEAPMMRIRMAAAKTPIHFKTSHMVHGF